MSVHNQDVQELKELKKLFESAVLPSIVKMIEVVGEQSFTVEQQGRNITSKLNHIEASQPDTNQITMDMSVMIRHLESIMEEGSANEQGFQILAQTITTFAERFNDLIETNNELIRSQKQQIKQVEDVIFSFEENTARLDTLTLAVEGLVKEQERQLNYSKEEPVFAEIENKTKAFGQELIIQSVKNSPPIVQTPTPSIYDKLNKKVEQLTKHEE